MSLTFLSPPFKAVKAEFVRQTVRNMPRWPAHVCAGKRRLQTRLSTTSIRTQSHSLTANRQVRGETSFLPDHDAAMSPPARARSAQTSFLRMFRLLPFCVRLCSTALTFLSLPFITSYIITSYLISSSFLCLSSSFSCRNVRFLNVGPGACLKLCSGGGSDCRRGAHYNDSLI